MSIHLELISITILNVSRLIFQHGAKRRRINDRSISVFFVFYDVGNETMGDKGWSDSEDDVDMEMDVDDGYDGERDDDSSDDGSHHDTMRCEEQVSVVL